MQSSILKYDHDLPSSIFDQTIKKVLFVSWAASSYNKKWLSFIAEKQCKVQAVSLIFSFVPQNQIGSSTRHHMCELSHKQIYAAIKTFCIQRVIIRQYKAELRLETKRCRFLVFGNIA